MRRVRSHSMRVEPLSVAWLRRREFYRLVDWRLAGGSGSARCAKFVTTTVASGEVATSRVTWMLFVARLEVVTAGFRCCHALQRELGRVRAVEVHECTNIVVWRPMISAVCRAAAVAGRGSKNRYCWRCSLPAVNREI